MRRRFTCNDNHNNSDHTSQKDKLGFNATKRGIKTMMYRLKAQVTLLFLRNYIISPLNSSFFVVLGQMLEGCWAQFARTERAIMEPSFRPFRGLCIILKIFARKEIQVPRQTFLLIPCIDGLKEMGWISVVNFIRQ